MAAVGKYKLTGGSTTQIIVMSICDTLSELGHAQLMQQSLQQARTLGNLVKPRARGVLDCRHAPLVGIFAISEFS